MAKLQTLPHSSIPSFFNASIFSTSTVLNTDDDRFNNSKPTLLNSALTSANDDVEQLITRIKNPQVINTLLFVDTGFYPTHNPASTLGVMEGERWITLPISLAQQTPLEQHQYIQSIIQQHYRAHPRGLPLWGDIQRYCYYQILADDTTEKVWFDVGGGVIE